MDLFNSLGMQKLGLTEEQRRMYAAEKLENFRWISQIIASYSSHELTKADLVAPEVEAEIAQIGQFAELVYSPLPLDFLLKQSKALSKPGFPLENYDALQDPDVVLEDSFKGSVAALPACILRRPALGQIIVAISGTSSLKQALYDLRVMKVKHPSGKGTVHSGFWDLYGGIRPQLLSGIKKALSSNAPSELVLTGHSMGGTIVHLLCMDLLAEPGSVRKGLTIKVVVFGAPRAGDAALVDHYRNLLTLHREKNGQGSFIEYSLKAYNDGVPALPPLKLGYRHFPREPIYTTGDRLYHVPSSENEHALFHVQAESDNESTRFPRGGHNYYNGRELEKFARRITWLDKAQIHQDGWKERYISVMHKNV